MYVMIALRSSILHNGARYSHRDIVNQRCYTGWSRKIETIKFGCIFYRGSAIRWTVSAEKMTASNRPLFENRLIILQQIYHITLLDGART